MLSRHPGQNMTIELIQHNYIWPGLQEFVKKYCKSCTICMKNEPQHHKPYGLLKQLPIPIRLWNSISMDFIETLLTSDGCAAILVVLVIVDWLSKQGIFILATIHCMSEDLVLLIIIYVFSKHGISDHIASNHGPEFVSHFFRSLGKALDMKC